MRGIDVAESSSADSMLDFDNGGLLWMSPGDLDKLDGDGEEPMELEIFLVMVKSHRRRPPHHSFWFLHETQSNLLEATSFSGHLLRQRFPLLFFLLLLSLGLFHVSWVHLISFGFHWNSSPQSVIEKGISLVQSVMRAQLPHQQIISLDPWFTAILLHLLENTQSMIDSLNSTQNLQKTVILLLVKQFTISCRLHSINHFIPFSNSRSLNKISFCIWITTPLAHSIKHFQGIFSFPNLTQIVDQHKECLSVSWSSIHVHIKKHLFNLGMKLKRILFPAYFANTIKN
ncbi:hypothetical protein F8388_001224 [Cannabis sativa]|uniref:Uncharacterized protein n=1 Tax=Cannabis sativa TaxID=3483 RepID=A0A7J6GIX1_CANSA|nr:hypothetical protein F8388_001224 [Cannabis sativa]